MSAIIEAALVKAGLLSATATEAEVVAALNSVYATLARATTLKGGAMTASKVAAELTANEVAAGGIAREIVRTGSIEALKSQTNVFKNAATRFIGPGAREAARQGGKRLIGGFVGTLSWPAWLAGVAILGAITAGGWMYTNKDKPSVEPVKPGIRMFGPQMPRDLTNNASEPLRADDSYFLYAVNTSGWSFYVGRPSDVENKPSNGFADGGTSTQPVEYRKLLDKPFKDPFAAMSYLKLAATPGKHSVWTGQWYKFSGEEFRGVHVGL